jgi:hypothetical protein
VFTLIYLLLGVIALFWLASRPVSKWRTSICDTAINS